MGNALQLTGGTEVNETAKFVLMFDKFFDIFNISNFTSSHHQHKPFKAPFRKGDDYRLTVSKMSKRFDKDIIFPQWLEEDFLVYLDEWEASVAARPHFTDAQKKQMILSTETLLGIRRSGKSKHIFHYLYLSIVKFLLSWSNLSFQCQK